ncbi:ribonucleoside-diphosphate reductase subunit alpha [Clostridium botulinum]|uniref:Ribonucleoside-diphosphate reductase n=1 Tax=Clostridium botulinum (strain Hall / ATCC 3502 / NCTC 13319 / Type A) TaxID=441771 RepID=A5I5Q0_CLOBH|nr:ribonucleoside-diphosphate reductase subunit alpha [Clostridium botulinum]ABS32378.1 ribonucleoside-diphosphate reductase, alpha subunit [Clostridium botulinum A str. ATCC 19397]AWB18606.1 ribonucleoside-diphosphate reductase subunit alpha [Clostridium botulinum]AWB31378.1 ribonucleoside-diphosphate reductase subunit alpha [Clostridium botulinum]EGT5616641.1 ribonucleoside-diphosphate reductase subunit alpha [Clostridium botulinum]EGT5621095.1 ribonucleoside-diphosphate reductase subunit al
MNIKIKKRDGQYEPLQVEKTKKMVKLACEGIEGCDPLELELDSRIQFRDGMTTKEIQRTLIQTAIEKVIQNSKDNNGNNIKKTNANWQYVAARLLCFDLYKEAKISRHYNSFGYGDYYQLVKKLVKIKLYGEYLIQNYSDEEIKELAKYIVPERDELFNYEGLKLLNDRYLIKGNNGEILELPQERFMTIAMHLAIPEGDKKVFYAKKFYDLLSELKVTVATPTLGNAGTPFYQLSSCFISVVGDNLWSIYDVNQKFAQVSKHGGALGIYTGKIRALNSEIRGHKNASGGVVPWIRLYNDTAVAVDQLGKRKGGAAITLDIWHKDIFDFLDLKTNNGDDRRKAHDIFPSVSIPDLFMKRLEKRESWSLFDPYIVEKIMGYKLEDYFDDEDRKEFTNKYLECERNTNIPRDTVPTLDIMKKLMKSAVETGTPFIFFRDTVNKANPNKHKGMIYSSNLCHEIAQNMSESRLLEEEIIDGNGYSEIVQRVKAGDMVTCNLNSINLSKVKKEEFNECIPFQIRMLDNVISLNKLPVKEAKVTSDKYRAIGLGTSGYHHFLANNKIRWESDEHIKVADEIYEEIAYIAIKSSMELAKEKGSYPAFKDSEWETGKYFERRGYNSERWKKLQSNIKKYGMRNGYITAIAPTGSTSNIANTTAGIDPVFKKFFMEEKKGSFTPKTAPDLNEENFWYYKEAHTIDQQWSIKACAVRQKHIDQAQSFNLYITPEIKAKEILNMYIESWKQGVKTIYYVRNKSLEMDECTSCSS